MNAVIVVVTLAAIPFALYLFGAFTLGTVDAAATPDVPDCADFEFDASEWQGDSREEQGRGLAACETLQGVPREEVLALLGEPDDRGGVGPKRGFRFAYEAGTSFDPSGTGGTTLELTVRFEDGVVEGTGFTRWTPYGEMD